MINKFGKLYRFVLFISFLILYIGISSLLAALWVQYNFGDIQWEQIMLNLSQPLTGVAVGLMISGIFLIIVFGFLITMCMAYLLYLFLKRYTPIGYLFVGFLCVLYPISHWHLADFILSRFMTGKLYEEEHTIPSIQINNRNLIVIVLESYEKSFQDKSVFGQNLSPYLSQLQYENISFDGFYQLRQTGWTITSLMAAFCGVPLKLNNMFVDLSTYQSFIPGLSCCPEQLKEQGYETVLMKAASIQFSGTDRFALQHGFQKAVGYRELKEQYGYISQTRWGLDDHQFYQAVQQELNRLSQTGKPFLLATVQVDTHNPFGHVNETCQTIYHDFRDAALCSDKEAGQLIRWIQKQPFYQNTTIVVMGDHLMPTTDIDSYVEKISDREIYFTIINPTPQQQPYTHAFTNLDIAPTILDAAGFKFDGQFGLGHSLFRPDKTLIETKGDKLEFELDCLSQKYQSWDNMISGSVFELPEMLTVLPVGQTITLLDGLNKYIGAQGMNEAALGQIWLIKNTAEMKFRLPNTLPADMAYELTFHLIIPLNGADTKQVRFMLNKEQVFAETYQKYTMATVQIQILPKQIQEGIVHLLLDVSALPYKEHRYDGIQVLDIRADVVPVSSAD